MLRFPFSQRCASLAAYREPRRLCDGNLCVHELVKTLALRAGYETTTMRRMFRRRSDVSERTPDFVRRRCPHTAARRGRGRRAPAFCGGARRCGHRTGPSQRSDHGLRWRPAPMERCRVSSQYGELVMAPNVLLRGRRAGQRLATARPSPHTLIVVFPNLEIVHVALGRIDRWGGKVAPRRRSTLLIATPRSRPNAHVRSRATSCGDREVAASIEWRDAATNASVSLSPTWVTSIGVANLSTGEMKNEVWSGLPC